MIYLPYIELSFYWSSEHHHPQERNVNDVTNEGRSHSGLVILKRVGECGNWCSGVRADTSGSSHSGQPASDFTLCYH